MKTLLMAAAFVAAFLFPVGERFKLHTPIFEANAFVACRDEKHAVELVKLLAANRIQEADAMFGRRVLASECFVGSGVTITYTRQAYRDGDFSVYEAKAEDVTFFVPMFGFKHEEVSA